MMMVLLLASVSLPYMPKLLARCLPGDQNKKYSPDRVLLWCESVSLTPAPDLRAM